MGNNQEINPLDDFLREQLEDFAPQPPAEMFSSIEQTVSGNASQVSSILSKGILKTISILAVSAVVVTGVLVYNNSTSKNESKSDFSNPKSENLHNNLNELDIDAKNANESIEEKNTNVTQSNISVNDNKYNSLANDKKEEKANINLTIVASGEKDKENKPSENSLSKKFDKNASSKENYKENNNSFTQNYKQPKSSFNYEWLDDNRLMITNLSKNALDYIWLINGKQTDQKFEDIITVKDDREHAIEKLSLIAINGSYRDTFIQSIKYDFDSKIEIANVFTPDADGINDTYKVVPPFATEFSEIRIMDQQFTVVFIGKEWDGTINGKPAENGIYYVVYTYKTKNMDAPKTKNQMIKLIRGN
jgi:gliding motility-associated-like protein